MLRILVLIRDFLSGGRIVGLDQALFCSCTVAVNRATMPDIKLWVVLRGVQTSDGLTGGKANVGCLDSGLLGEGLCPTVMESEDPLSLLPEEAESFTTQPESASAPAALNAAREMKLFFIRFSFESRVCTGLSLGSCALGFILT